MFVCMCACLCVRLCVCLCVRLCVTRSACVYVYIYVCACVCMCVFVHVRTTFRCDFGNPKRCAIFLVRVHEVVAADLDREAEARVWSNWGRLDSCHGRLEEEAHGGFVPAERGGQRQVQACHGSAVVVGVLREPVSVVVRDPTQALEDRVNSRCAQGVGGKGCSRHLVRVHPEKTIKKNNIKNAKSRHGCA